MRGDGVARAGGGASLRRVGAWATRRLEAVPAGVKLASVALLGFALFGVGSAPVLSGIAVLAVAAALIVTGPRACREALGYGLALSVAGVVVLAALFDGVEAGTVALSRMLALLAVAHLVASTTRTSEIEDAIVAAVQPFERLPFVSANAVGLALALALRSVPRLREAAREIRDAHAARGLKASPARLVVPLVARVLADAEALADAIEARGWSARGTR